MKMILKYAFAPGLALSILFPQFAAAQVPVAVVVPAAQATTEGNISNQFPFNPRSVGTITIRYQQVYSASEFAAGRYLISRIAFRPDGYPNEPFVGTIGNIQIDLSTTSRQPDGLSTTFADNVGADSTTVFSGALTLSSANNGPAGGPFPFDIVIDLTTPFLYDPAAGNLLMDVRNFGGGTLNVLNNTLVFFDAQNTAGDAISRVYSATSFDGVNDAVGSVDPVGSLGLVTQFTADFTSSSPVPEEQIDSLVATIENLVTGGSLKAGQANGLIRPLQNALSSLAKGKVAPACSQLYDFQVEVTRKVLDGVLTAAQGVALVNAAASIRSNLGC